MRLITEGGRIGLGATTETGEWVFVPLERVRTHRNADKRGTYRCHNDYRRQCPTTPRGTAITYAMGVNAMSMHVHRQGLAPPIAA